MTEFERAQIRLKIWEALAGWGIKKGKNELHETWNWKQRLENAEKLYEWVCK